MIPSAFGSAGRRIRPRPVGDRCAAVLGMTDNQIFAKRSSPSAVRSFSGNRMAAGSWATRRGCFWRSERPRARLPAGRPRRRLLPRRSPASLRLRRRRDGQRHRLGRDRRGDEPGRACSASSAPPGLPLARVEAAIDRLQRSLGDAPVRLQPDPQPQRAGPRRRRRRSVPAPRRPPGRGVGVSRPDACPSCATALHGIHADAAGRIVTPNRIIAKVSRVEVASKFFAPPPERILQRTGAPRRADRRSRPSWPRAVPWPRTSPPRPTPAATPTTARPITLCRRCWPCATGCKRSIGYRRPLRVGAAGGIATPASAAAAFAMGAAYVAHRLGQPGLRRVGLLRRGARRCWPQAEQADVTMAPAADMFEMGVKVQVLKRGTMFAMRAAKLYELYRSLRPPRRPARRRTRRPGEEPVPRAAGRDLAADARLLPASAIRRQVERAEREPKHKMALVFRWYLGQSSRWANAGEPTRKLDYQVWCGPAMGAFNEWAKGSFLERPRNRRVVTVALNLLYGAAVLTRLHAAALPGRRAAAGVVARRRRLEPELRVGDCRLQETPAGTASRTDLTSNADDDPPCRRSPSSASAACFPRRPTSREYWANIKNGVDAITDVPPTHWQPTTTSTPTPRRPIASTPRAAASSIPSLSTPPSSASLPTTSKPPTRRSCSAWSPPSRRSRTPATATGPRAFDRKPRQRASSASPARWSWSSRWAPGSAIRIWRRALQEAGVADDVAEDVVAAHRRFLRRLAGELLPRPARQRRRRAASPTASTSAAPTASSMPPAPARSAPSTWPPWSWQPAGPTWCSPAASTRSTTSSCTCASARRRPCRRRATPGRSTPAADGTILGEGLGMVVLKRLADAERDGDRIYAVLRGIGSSSDGKGNAIYAPSAGGPGRRPCATPTESAGVTPGHGRAGRGARHRHAGRRCGRSRRR